ncbi:MAG: dihydrolipoyl dehydrogenase family protein [Alphaproteobacteria bacterium]
MKEMKVDVCVIGAGSGGLSVASGSAQLGVKTVLIEKGEMGGDCLNYGCVPSKALLHVGKVAQTIRKADQFGITVGEPQVDYAKAMNHVHEAIARIAPHDSQERFEGLGVHVIRDFGRFVDSHTVEAGDTRIKAKFFVIATGSSAFVPPVPGLADVPYLTNENLFEQTEKPEHLAIMGGGPIGIEMAQAHARLGSKVTVIEMAPTIMGKDDPDLVDIVRQCLVAEGINLLEGTKVAEVSGTAGDISLTLEGAEGTSTLKASHLLIATGRKVNTDGLNLEAAGVDYTRGGITVKPNMRTSRRHIFAIGDVAGGPQFTHMAGHHASVVVREMLFRMAAKAETKTVPWVTYTDPELAQIGMTETAAHEAGLDPKVELTQIGGVDRYIAEGVDGGLAKLVFDGKGKLIGAGMVAPNAGDLIAPLGMVISGQIKLSALASQIVPYPTHADVPKRMAGAHLASYLFADRTRRLISWLLKLPA